MKILFVTPAPPFPPRDGSRLIVANLARVLAPEHSLSLVSLSEQDGTAVDMREWFVQSRIVRLRTERKVSKWLTSFSNPLPMWVRVSESAAMREAIQETLSQTKFDVVHLDSAKMAQFIDAARPLPIVLAPHDSLTMILEQWQTTGPAISDRAYARLEAQKMRRYEATQYRLGDRICVVTPQEARFLQSLAPALTVRVIPNGVDTEFFAPAPAGSEKPASIGFLGVMDYIPNRRAAQFFAREVMPLVWRAVPDAVFTIIGRDPTRDILALADDSRIRVSGTVEDVRPYMAAQEVMVVPMREESGIKNKLLEAMAMGKAVVTTPDALGGIDARPGHELLVGANTAELAGACISVLGDAGMRAQLEQNARAWALEHSWRKTAAQYLDLYCEAMHAAAGR